MKILLQVLLALGFTGYSAFGGDVQSFVSDAAKNIPDHEVMVAQVRELETIMPRKQLVDELITELMDADDPVSEVVVNTMLLGMEPFPFDEIHQQLTPQANSTKRAYLLFLLNKGASGPAQVDEVLELAKSMLGDKDKGIRRYGEARAYSVHGLRVCDMAYNVLVSRLSLDPPMMQVDVDNYVPNERDALILELAERTSIRLSADGSNSAGSKPDAPKGIVNVPKLAPTPKTLEAKPTASTPSEEPASSTPWSSIVALILVSTGLLWLLVKNRK